MYKLNICILFFGVVNIFICFIYLCNVFPYMKFSQLAQEENNQYFILPILSQLSFEDQSVIIFLMLIIPKLGGVKKIWE